MADRVGADVITVHPGRRTAKRHPSAYDFRRFEEYIDRLREAAGQTRVRVAIENLEPRVNALLSMADDAAEVLEREPWLWLTFDMGRHDDILRRSDPVHRPLHRPDGKHASAQSAGTGSPTTPHGPSTSGS